MFKCWSNNHIVGYVLYSTFAWAIPKTFDDFEVMSVICFAQDNLESNFTPSYE